MYGESIVLGHPAGYELCHKVSYMIITIGIYYTEISRSGIAITSTYAMRHCTRLLEVCVTV